MSNKPLAIVYYSNLMPGGQIVNRLQDLGYRVINIGDPSLLTETCERETPLLAVAELIPGGPALSSVRKLRDTPATAHVPVLGYSTVHEPAWHAQAAEAGVTLLVGSTAVAEHLPRLLDQVLQIE